MEKVRRKGEERIFPAVLFSLPFLQFAKKREGEREGWAKGENSLLRSILPLLFPPFCQRREMLLPSSFLPLVSVVCGLWEDECFLLTRTGCATTKSLSIFCRYSEGKKPVAHKRRHFGSTSKHYRHTLCPFSGCVGEWRGGGRSEGREEGNILSLTTLLLPSLALASPQKKGKEGLNDRTEKKEKEEEE